jgi:hypothetical protein
MKNMKTILNAISGLIDELEDVDLGYPLEGNTLHARSDHTVPLSELAKIGSLSPKSQLMEFYINCDGLDLPDIYNGYFIDSAEKLLTSYRGSEPTKMIGHAGEEDILVFGGDGGGGRFAIKTVDGSVLYLPLDSVHSKLYEGDPRKVKRLANSFYEFLIRLHDDVQNFIQCNSNWKYMV